MHIADAMHGLSVTQIAQMLAHFCIAHFIIGLEGPVDTATSAGVVKTSLPTDVASGPVVVVVSAPLVASAPGWTARVLHDVEKPTAAGVCEHVSLGLHVPRGCQVPAVQAMRCWP